MHVLVLGGTSESARLAAMLARWGVRATLSLAGRTLHPAPSPLPRRIGGFGGAEGLAGWMRREGVTALVDATHPFAARMPFSAARAADLTGTPLLALVRPPWRAGEGDDWTEVPGHSEAVEALGPVPRRVFLTVGRLELEAYASGPPHRYLVRTIDPPVEPRPLPDAEWVAARGPFRLEDERGFLGRVDVLVTKNSGGSATEAKLEAARLLGRAVVMVRRPPRPPVPAVETPEEALSWIRALS